MDTISNITYSNQTQYVNNIFLTFDELEKYIDTKLNEIAEKGGKIIVVHDHKNNHVEQYTKMTNRPGWLITSSICPSVVAGIGHPCVTDLMPLEQVILVYGPNGPYEVVWNVNMGSVCE